MTFASRFRGLAIAISAVVFVSRASFADVVAGPRSSVAVRLSVAALVGEVASDAAAVDVSAVDTVRGGDGVGGIGEGDEGAPARAAGVVVRDDLHGQHLAVALENITHGALVGGESEPTHEHRGGGGVGCARRARRARRARGPGASARGVGWRSMLRVNAKGGGTGTVLARIDVHLVQASVASRVPCQRPNGRLESAAPRDVESDGAEIRGKTFFPARFGDRRWATCPTTNEMVKELARRVQTLAPSSPSFTEPTNIRLAPPYQSSMILV